MCILCVTELLHTTLLFTRSHQESPLNSVCDGFKHLVSLTKIWRILHATLWTARASLSVLMPAFDSGNARAARLCHLLPNIAEPQNLGGSAVFRLHSTSSLSKRRHRYLQALSLRPRDLQGVHLSTISVEIRLASSCKPIPLPSFRALTIRNHFVRLSMFTAWSHNTARSPPDSVCRIAVLRVSFAGIRCNCCSRAASRA